MADEKKTLSQVSVRGTGDDGKVVLWERHPDHPKPKGKKVKTGEAFISNDGKSRIVAETAEVKRLIGLGLLERTKAGEDKKTKDDKKTDDKKGEKNPPAA